MQELRAQRAANKLLDGLLALERYSDTDIVDVLEEAFLLAPIRLESYINKDQITEVQWMIGLLKKFFEDNPGGPELPDVQ